MRTCRIRSLLSLHFTGPTHSLEQLLHFLAKPLERSLVRRSLCPDHDVDRGADGEQKLAHEFAEPSFQSVSLDRGMPMTRYDDSHTQACMRGSARPNQ